MKYRDIAKIILLKRGSTERVASADTILVGEELNEGRETFTEKQVRKIQEALDDTADKLRKKWKID